MGGQLAVQAIKPDGDKADVDTKERQNWPSARNTSSAGNTLD
jgi:hypothetical protein